MGPGPPGGERELQRRRFSGQEPWLMLVLPATDAGEAARGGGGGVFRCAKKVSGMSGRGRRYTGVRQTETRRGRGRCGARRGRGGIPVLLPM
jgi:hypothetical protein